jgi:hypothetical protein
MWTNYNGQTPTRHVNINYIRECVHVFDMYMCDISRQESPSPPKGPAAAAAAATAAGLLSLKVYPGSGRRVTGCRSAAISTLRFALCCFVEAKPPETCKS